MDLKKTQVITEEIVKQELKTSKKDTQNTKYEIRKDCACEAYSDSA